MTGPLLIVIHLIPQGVLAGLFFVMGVQALEGNGITTKILFLCKDRSLTPNSEPLKRIERRKAIWWFVSIQLLGFAATFAITQTIAAVGFPVFILALVPIRTWLLPRWFEEGELRLLDGPTASPFTMISVGGNYGEDVEVDDVVGDEDQGSGETVGNAGSVSEGKLVGKIDGDDSDEGRAERGEGPGISGQSERQRKRGGSWREGEGLGESIEMVGGVRRRSVSRQPK